MESKEAINCKRVEVIKDCIGLIWGEVSEAKPQHKWLAAYCNQIGEILSQMESDGYRLLVRLVEKSE